MATSDRGKRSGPVLLPSRPWLVSFAFVAAYVGIGIIGLALQSAQAGVTPVWPASGLAFGLTYWFGLRYALLVVPSMLLLASLFQVPVAVALLAGCGSVLEAAVAAGLLRRLHVDPSLMQLRDSLVFVSGAAVLAPVLSAVAGSVAIALFTPGPVDAPYVGAVWWLGNSLGILVVGGLALVLPGPKNFPLYGRHWMELVGLCAAALLLTWLSILRVQHVDSALLLYLLVPLIVVAALRLGQFGVLMVAAAVLGTFIAANAELPHEELGRQGFGVLYLNLSLLWMATFTGLIVGSARQERRQREEVSWLADHDPLTGLVNRHAFHQRLDRALLSARDQGREHAVLAVDLDRFKRINDTEGHAAGDRVLRDVAGMLSREVRSRDTVARTGGDEFALLLESCPLVEACGVAENMRRALEEYVYRGVHGDYQVEASIGVVEVDAEAGDRGSILHGADLACYEAKRSGRNRVWVGGAKAPVQDGDPA